MAPANPRIIALFDVDGTLTVPRGEITPEMLEFMKTLSTKITVGIVGGSDLPKQEEQLGANVVNLFPYNFSQNGLVAYKDGELQEVQTIAKFLGEENIKRIVNWTMRYLADIDIPVKVRESNMQHTLMCIFVLGSVIFISPINLHSNEHRQPIECVCSESRGEPSSNSAVA